MYTNWDVFSIEQNVRHVKYLHACKVRFEESWMEAFVEEDQEGVQCLAEAIEDYGIKIQALSELIQRQREES